MTGSNITRLVVGVSGASCSGKTTLTKLLKATFPWANVIHQDAYYYPNETKYHVYLPDVKHFNWDLKSAVNFPQMEQDVREALNTPPNQTLNTLSSQNEKLLCCPNDEFVRKNSPHQNEVNYLISRFSKIPMTILEGHMIFNHPQFYQACNLRYFLTLDQEELFTRRRERVYDPPNPPGYLEKYVWPAYLSRLQESKELPGITYYDAKSISFLQMYRYIRQSVAVELANKLSPTSPLTGHIPPTQDQPFDRMTA